MVAILHFPLKNCFLFGLLYIVTKIYDASAQITQPPPSILEPPSIPLPRWPMEPKGPQSGYQVLPEYAQQKIRQNSEIAHPPPPDRILRTEMQQNPFRPQQSNTFNPPQTNWMPQQRNQNLKDSSIKDPGFNPVQQGPSNNPAYSHYPYKPQYPNGYTKYEPNGPPFQKSPDSQPQNRMPTRFDHNTPAKVNKPQNNGYTYPQPPPGYYGPEKQDPTPKSGIPQAILEYLQTQQAKDGLPPSLLNYLHSQAGEPVPQSVQARTTPASPVEVSTALSHPAPQQNNAAHLQHPLPQESSTESPTAKTTDQPATPVVELTTRTVADELMAKLSSQLESQSAAVQQLTDSYTTLSPLGTSTDPANSSDALSLQFRKLLLKKLIARRLLTLKTIGNLSKNTTTVAPVNIISETVTATPSVQQHNSAAEGPAHSPHATSAESQAPPHGSQGQGNVHQQSLPANPTVDSQNHQATGALQDLTTTMSPGLLPGERFPPNSHYVGHLPSEAMAGPRTNHRNNQFQPPNGYQQSFNAQRPNTYKGNPHFGNQHREPMNPQNAARNNIQTKTASASGIPEISYVHSGHQNHQAEVSPKPATATQRSKSFVYPAFASKGPSKVTEPTPIFGAPNEMQTIIIPSMNNPTAKPGMVRVVYIPGKGGAKGFFRVIHVSAPETSNPSTTQPLSPIQKYFSQDRLNNQQYPTPEQLRNAIKQENMIKSRKDPSQIQHGSKAPQTNPVFESPQKFPAVDSTPLTGSQTNVKDSLVGLLNTLEPINANKGSMSGYNQQKQAPNQWKNFAPPRNDYIQKQPTENTGRFDPKYPKEQMTQNSNVTPKTVTKIQEPFQHQSYQEFTNFQQGNKKHGPEMKPHSPNLDPYYKLVEEQIRQNTILTIAATPTTTTSQPIQNQFGYKNVPYGVPWGNHRMSNRNSISTTAASPTTTSQPIQTQFGYKNVPYGAQWGNHRMSNGNQQNQGGVHAVRPLNHSSRSQKPVVMTTEIPTTPVSVQNFETGSRLSAHNSNDLNMVSQQPQAPVTMDGRMQPELTGAVKGTSGSIDVPGNPASHSDTKQRNNVGASSYPGPKAKDTAASAGQGTNTAGTVQDQLVQQTMMELLNRQPHLLQGNNLQELIHKLSQNMSVPLIDKHYNLNQKVSKTSAPSSSAMATDSPSLQMNSRSLASPDAGHRRHAGSNAAHFEHRPTTPAASIYPVSNKWIPVNAKGAHSSHAEQLVQAKNLQDLIEKLSQNMSVPLNDNFLHEKASKSSSSATATNSPSLQSNGRLSAYPEYNAELFVNRPETRPAPLHPVPNQWNPVNANRAHNPNSGHHRNMNQYHREMHQGVYHYQGYEVSTTTRTPSTTTALPTTAQPLPDNSYNQHQQSARYDTYGPQSQYPLRGPQRNFPIPIFEHTVLDKLKAQQSKPAAQPQPENSQWKQQQQNHTIQQQNHWQQPSSATNNQPQQNHTVQQQNHWQQPAPATNNQPQQNHTTHQQNYWQHPEPATNNQQQQNHTIQQHNYWQQPSLASKNQQPQNHKIQQKNHWQQPSQTNDQQKNQSSVEQNNHWQQQQNRYEQQHHGRQQNNQMHQQQNSTNLHQHNAWQQQQNQKTNQNYHQTNQQQAHQQYPRNQYQTHANQQQHQQYYQSNQHGQMHPQQNNQQATASIHQNKHHGQLHHGQSSVVGAKPLQIRMPGNVNLGAPQSSMTAGSYQVAQVQIGRTTSSSQVDTLSLQRSPLVDPVSPSGGVPDLTAGLPKLVVSFPGGGVSPGSDVLGLLDPQLLLGGNPNPIAPGTGMSAPPPAPMTSTVAPYTTTMMPTTTIPPAHTFSSEQMCTMQSECEMGCCYTLQGEILWDWKTMVEPPHLPQVGYCHTKASTELGDGCEANFCPCASANQVCLSVPPENFAMPAGYDVAEQGTISFGKCRSTAQKKAALSHMTQAKMLVDMCMSDPSCPLHSMQLQKKKKK